MTRPTPKQLRSFFLGWQCRVRQIAMRQFAGRPLPGMQPRVLGPDGEVLMEEMTTLLVPEEPEESTAFFQFQLKRTVDPAEAYAKTLDYLQAEYFQDPSAFSDVMTALFGADAPTARALAAGERCILEIEQYQQGFRIPCRVAAMDADEPAYQATLWHNRAFNPGIPDGVTILSFTPNWRSAKASPPPP